MNKEERQAWLTEFKRKVAAEREVAMALAKRFTQEELGTICDFLMYGPEPMQSLCHAAGVAWADYAYGGDEDAATDAAVKRGEIL